MGETGFTAVQDGLIDIAVPHYAAPLFTLLFAL